MQKYSTAYLDFDSTINPVLSCSFNHQFRASSFLRVIVYAFMLNSCSISSIKLIFQSYSHLSSNFSNFFLLNRYMKCYESKPLGLDNKATLYRVYTREFDGELYTEQSAFIYCILLVYANYFQPTLNDQVLAMRSAHGMISSFQNLFCAM